MYLKKLGFAGAGLRSSSNVGPATIRIDGVSRCPGTPYLVALNGYGSASRSTWQVAPKDV